MTNNKDFTRKQEARKQEIVYLWRLNSSRSSFLARKEGRKEGKVSHPSLSLYSPCESNKSRTRILSNANSNVEIIDERKGVQIYQRRNVFAYISSNYRISKNYVWWIGLLSPPVVSGKFFRPATLPCRYHHPLPRDNGHCWIEKQRERERERESDHEIFTPLKWLSVVTINNHEPRNNVPPDSFSLPTHRPILSLSLYLSVTQSSMSRCHGDATSFNCETFPPQYEAMNQRLAVSISV